MAAFAIFKSVKSGAIDAKYLEFAEKMKKGALTKVDEYGYVQDAAGSPYFNAPGTSTEAQAFLLMMLAAEEKLAGQQIETLKNTTIRCESSINRIILLKIITFVS